MSNLLKVQSLAPGDTIGVYSPSSGIEPELKENYERGKQTLLKAGYKILEAPHTFEWKAHYSSDGQSKVADLMNLLRNPDVKAILPTLGGTTSYQMLPHLDFNLVTELLSKHPKMLFGFSDNCLQSNVISNFSNIVTFHGHSDVVFGLGDLEDSEKMKNFDEGGRYTRKAFFDALEGRLKPGTVKKATPWRILKKGQSKGRLMGGNIDVLQILQGTPYALKWANSIFFWEACYIELHRVDLALALFALSGILGQISGMIVGKGTHLSEQFFEAKHENLDEIILRHCAPYDFPILVDADIGHDMECCMLPIGVNARIENDELLIEDSPYV